MGHIVDLLSADESGQDLIEYALLASLIGFAAVAVFDVLRDSIADVYGSWNDSTNALSETPDPAPAEP